MPYLPSFQDLYVYDVLDFGAEVYNGRLYNDFSEIIAYLLLQDNRKAFIFSTTGSMTYSSIAHDHFKK